MRTSLLQLLTALAIGAPLVAGAQAAVPAPREALGIEIGADRTLADWGQITSYFARLATASPAVTVDTLGATTDNRPFIVAAISTPGNIRRLDTIRQAQARLADPRRLTSDEERRLVAEHPAVVLISCNIHATEIASSQMAMELAHRLATNDTLQRWLEDVVVLLMPSMNPDGQQMITEWYRKNLGTQWEGGPLPWLYHPYVGHDNNRDWYMVTQKETRLATDFLYRRWFPQIVYDVHQMGNEGMRLFVPPMVDPVNPNLDPRIVRGINLIGAQMAFALEAAGKSGVGDGVSYDLWWHGGFRSTPTRHNMVALLTEAASVRIATPIVQDTSRMRGHARGLPRYERRVNFPNPWPGGTWRMRDIMDYELIAAEALVRLAAHQREVFVREFAEMGRRQVELGKTESPRAFAIPFVQRDAGATKRLIEVLQVGGVEVHAGQNAFWVLLDQPYRAHAKDLLEVQRFPRIARTADGPPERPYDVAGWTLPLQMGVTARATDSVPARASLALVDEASTSMPACPAASALPRGEYLTVDPRDTDSYRWIMRVLHDGGAVRISNASATTTAGAPLPRGTFVIERQPSAPASVPPTLTPRCGRVRALPAGRSLTRAPRVALYKPWTASMDEGWTRWVFEQFSVPYITLTDSMMKAGKLRDQFDVVLVPDMSLREARDGMSASQVPPPYAGGMGTAGLTELQRYVNDGGTLVLLDRASEIGTQALGVPVTRITVPPRGGEETAGRADSAGRQRQSLYAPGSILRVIVDTTHAVAAGMPDTAAVYFTNSVTFDVPAGSPARVIARYPQRSDDILLSGFLEGGEAIAGRAAAVDVPVGRGRVIMFGFRPQYRGQSYGTFRMLFNALLDGVTPARR